MGDDSSSSSLAGSDENQTASVTQPRRWTRTTTIQSSYQPILSETEPVSAVLGTAVAKPYRAIRYSAGVLVTPAIFWRFKLCLR